MIGLSAIFVTCVVLGFVVGRAYERANYFYQYDLIDLCKTLLTQHEFADFVNLLKRVISRSKDPSMFKLFKESLSEEVEK